MENLKTSEFEIPENCGYNKIFRYNWITPVYGLSMSLIPVIHKLCNKRWGWHFKPNPAMNYNDERWFEKQKMVLSFEDEKDLVFVKISIDIHK